MCSHFVYGTSHRHMYPRARLGLLPSERIIIPLRFLSKKAVYLDSKVLCGPQCPCKKSAKLSGWYWSQTADLELIFNLFSKNSSIPMLVLRGSLQEHVLALLGTDLACKNSLKCSGMHRCMRSIEGVIYGERLKKPESPEVSSPNDACKHKRWRTLQIYKYLKFAISEERGIF